MDDVDLPIRSAIFRRYRGSGLLTMATRFHGFRRGLRSRRRSRGCNVAAYFGLPGMDSTIGDQ